MISLSSLLFIPPPGEGYAVCDLKDEKLNLEPLFKTIIEKVPSPKGYFDKPLQLLVSSIDYDEYVGRIAVGRIERGGVKSGQQAVICRKDGDLQQC